MKLLCGDDCGTIKVVSVSKEGTEVVDNWGEIHPRHSITKLGWANEKYTKTEFFSLHLTGTISFQYITGHSRFNLKNKRNDIFSAFSFHPQSDNNRVIIYLTETGDLVTINVDLENATSDPTSIKYSTKKLNPKVPKLECSDLSGDKREICYGGREEVVKVWDLEKNSQAWSSQNIPPDGYNIPHPIWESGCCFGIPSEGNNLICTCTKYHELRLYDRRVGQREIYRNSWGEHAYNCVIPSPLNPYEFICGSAIGRVLKWNQKRVEENVVFRNLNFSGVEIYKAAVGSVRDMCFLNNVNIFGKNFKENYVCCVGVDRYLRIFDYSSKNQKFAAFLWKKQNCVLPILDDEETKSTGTGQEKVKAQLEEEEEEEEEEESKKSKKRKRGEGEEIFDDDFEPAKHKRKVE